MSVDLLAPAERAEFLDLADACLRPEGGPTRWRDDFPTALGPGNRDGLLVWRQDGSLAAGLACLVRPFRTSVGRLPVAMIGSVFTRPGLRGRGLSAVLQREALDRARAAGAVLAVLWSDRPQLYAGRGFAPAGLEHHVDLAPWRPEADGAGPAARPYVPGDAAAVAALHRRHRLRMERTEAEEAGLRAMPGTRGLVLTAADGAVAAAVFCGKGADFPGWAHEWAGPPPLAARLLAEARRRGLARWLLAPQGGEPLLGRLTRRGARALTAPSGLWRVLRPEPLAEAFRRAGREPPPAAARGEAAAWLGGPGPDGVPRPGPLRAAVWGFDSI